MKRFGCGLAITGVMLLAGCATSPPARYYTLMQTAAAQASANNKALLAAPAGSVTVLEVLPVSVALQVDQPQIMLRDGAGAVVPRYSDRWTAPLSDEIRSALSDGLTRRLGMFDVHEVKPVRDQPVWRIQVDVQRFDSILGDAAVVDATWRLRGIHIQTPTVICRTQIRQAVSSNSVEAIVAAHQKAMATLSQAIATRIAGGADTTLEGVEQLCRTASNTDAAS